MERAFKWALPLLLLVEIALVWGRVLDIGTALLIIIFVEMLLALLSLRQMIVAARRYRQNRSAGLDIQAALEEGLTVFVPRAVARVLTMEPQIFVCLYQWLRRRPLQPNEFSYAKRSIMGSMLVLVALTGPVEILIAELLIPWPFVRWIVLALSIYSFLWLMGLYASLRVRPYRLEGRGLRIHYGVLARGFIPYDQISAVELSIRKTPQRSEGLLVVPSEGAAYSAFLPSGGKTDVTVRLREPVALQRLVTTTTPVSEVHLAVDEPARFVHATRERLRSHVDSPDNSPALPDTLVLNPASA